MLEGFERRVAAIPRDLCAPFHSEARQLETELLSIYRFVALSARNEADLGQIAKAWALMVKVCDESANRLNTLVKQRPDCGADAYYDRVLDSPPAHFGFDPFLGEEQHDQPRAHLYCPFEKQVQPGGLTEGSRRSQRSADLRSEDVMAFDPGRGRRVRPLVRPQTITSLAPLPGCGGSSLLLIRGCRSRTRSTPGYLLAALRAARLLACKKLICARTADTADQPRIHIDDPACSVTLPP
jgi:hypothetical protein